MADNRYEPPAEMIDTRRERMTQEQRDAEDAEASRARKSYSRQVERYAGRDGVGRVLEGLFGSQAREGGPKRMKRGGTVKMAAGGKVRGDGSALRGKTRGKTC